MRRILISLIVVSMAVLSFVLPRETHAANVIVGDPKDWLSGVSGTGAIDPAQVNLRVSLPVYVINLMLIGLVITSFAFVLIGGIKWIMSGGTKDGVAKARGTITYALIGLALGLGSFIIFQVALSLIGAKIF